jgi:predicted DNA-binding transcriptional regulator AlpA
MSEINEIKLLTRRQVAEVIGRTPDTLDFWVKQGFFPAPMQAFPGAPKAWRFAVVRDWIEKRQRSRYRPPTPRGQLKRGSKRGGER